MAAKRQMGKPGNEEESEAEETGKQAGACAGDEQHAFFDDSTLHTAPAVSELRRSASSVKEYLVCQGSRHDQNDSNTDPRTILASNPGSMKTEEKTNVPRVRIAVLGNINVGKSAILQVLNERHNHPIHQSSPSTHQGQKSSMKAEEALALTVRYLTRRFIGEYSSNTDLLYKQTVTLDSGVLDVEIVDISAENDNGFPVEQIQWADACLIVYSITDRSSYEYAQRSLAELRQLQNAPSAYLVANKADLDHLRELNSVPSGRRTACVAPPAFAGDTLRCSRAIKMSLQTVTASHSQKTSSLPLVQETEGASLAASHAIGFCEVSVADNSPALYKAFERLLIESRARPVKPRKFSVSKMFGTLIGNAGTRQAPVNQGTVVPCHKGELHKSRVMKRRQAFTATASL
ncbi:MRAS2 [Anopheles darlingi]|uniref:small monomeric GTPase n=1 Tax=Anopheles darlingi TaxID=43151 RepID=W5JBR9_ANODA|nr:MRAS2 [Anopheles darlingi]